MAISEYLRMIRLKVGNDLLLLPSVTGVVWDDQERLLMIRQPGYLAWTLPGGIVDPGESPAAALVREVWEETGIVVRPIKIIGVFGGHEGFRRTYPNGHQVEFVDTAFQCTVVCGRPKCVDGEAVEVRFFCREEFAALQFQYPIKLADITAKNEYPIFSWSEAWLEGLRSRTD
jgi:8-oxo-dGTP pyrophosphatase MutT (NUDIX family)